ncbi:heterokaryon incompatibility protein-domain-containing protein, partial [Cercophora scortea]
SGIGQVLNTLSEANSKALLSEHSNLTHSRRDEAAAILSRLQELNPTIASQFGAKQDAISSLVLRMLSTQEPASGSFSSFIAVSYCWHYAEHWPLAPAATPIAPGWEISQPMVDAVMGLRVNADEGVWLDKLCINQNDETDKILHIGAMDTVYRSARRIVILLEDIQLDREEETAALAYSAMYADMVKQVKEQELEGQAKADFIFQFLPREEAKYREERRDDVLAGGKAFAKKLLAARWFSRAWCAHESRVAHHHRIKDSERIPLFLCYGHDGSVLSFEFRFMFFLAMHLSDSEPEVNLVGTAYMDALNDPNPTSLRQLWWRIQRLLPDNAQVSAMQHLVSIVSFGCFNKGDLISIALNTAQIPLFFRGDVEFEDDVLWIFSVLMLAAGDVVPLVLHGVKLRMVDADGKKTISWMSRPFQGALDDSLPIAAQNTITSVTREYIELD